MVVITYILYGCVCVGNTYQRIIKVIILSVGLSFLLTVLMYRPIYFIVLCIFKFKLCSSHTGFLFNVNVRCINCIVIV